MAMNVQELRMRLHHARQQLDAEVYRCEVLLRQKLPTAAQLQQLYCKCNGALAGFSW
jgi:hypothetical protein